MAVEIERKYLVADDSYKRMSVARKEISQGYLSRDPDRTVRVRLCGDRGFLTVKGRNDGPVRPEFEYEVPGDDARRMLSLCAGRIVFKTRWIVDFGGFRWEVDEFHGDLDGMVVAEIELPDAGASFALPPFAGREVTGDPAYYNSML